MLELLTLYMLLAGLTGIGLCVEGVDLVRRRRERQDWTGENGSRPTR
jgi:hypothetical protein